MQRCLEREGGKARGWPDSWESSFSDFGFYFNNARNPLGFKAGGGGGDGT